MKALMACYPLDEAMQLARMDPVAIFYESEKEAQKARRKCYLIRKCDQRYGGIAYDMLRFRVANNRLLISVDKRKQDKFAAEIVARLLEKGLLVEK